MGDAGEHIALPVRAWTGMPPEDEIDRLRAEVAEWRRRAEVAEAVAAERLARAETAERALRAAEAALSKGPTARSLPSSAAPVEAESRVGEDAAEAGQRRPASLRERWRRYTETIN